MSEAVVKHPKESINLQTHAWYFEECERNRDLLTKIQVVIPVRPADGVNTKLSEKLSIWYGEGTPWCYLNDHMGGFIEITRANIAYQFKHDFPHAEWLLMIDNDMAPPINLPYLLARHGEPIVAAPCMSVSDQFGPQLCFTVRDVKGAWRFPAVRSCHRIPKSGLVNCGHCGTGAMMIHRSVIEQFSFEAGDIPFYVPEDVRVQGARTGTLLRGEDITFCEQVRQKGYRVLVDMEAHTGHRKQVTLIWDDANRDPHLAGESWVLPEDGLLFADRL